MTYTASNEAKWVLSGKIWPAENPSETHQLPSETESTTASHLSNVADISINIRRYTENDKGGKS